MRKVGFNVRVEPDLHRALVSAARTRGQSMNEFIERTLGQAVGIEVPDRVIRTGAAKPAAQERLAGKRKEGRNAAAGKDNRASSRG